MKGWLLLLKKQKKQNERQPFSICVMMYLVLCVYSFPFKFYLLFFFPSFFISYVYILREEVESFVFFLLCFAHLLARSVGGVVVTFSLPCLRSAWRRKKYESKRSDPLSLVFTLLLFPVSLPRATTSILHYTIHGIKYNKYLFTIN